MTDFHSAKTALEATNDRNFCAPLAVSIVADEPAQMVADMMGRLGRRKRCGTPVWITRRVLDDLNCEIKDVTIAFRARGAKTITTLPRLLDPKKRYLVWTRGHILACTNGKVQDWTEGRRHRILRVQEVTRTIPAPAPVVTATYEPFADHPVQTKLF